MNSHIFYKRLVFWVVFVLLMCCSFASVVMAANQVEISFATWQWGEPGFGSFFKDAAKVFEEKTGIKVKSVEIPMPIYDNTLFTQFHSGEGPDIIMPNSPCASYIPSGGLIPLDAYMEKSSVDFSKWPKDLQFSDEFGYMVDGKTYGIAINNMPCALMYNTKIFEEAGVLVPVYPQEFYETAIKLTGNGQYGYPFYNGPGSQLVNEIVMWQFMYGGRFFDEKNPPYPTVNTPQNMEALSMFKRLFDAGVAPIRMEKTFNRQLFWEGKAAMLIDGIWMIGFIKEENPDMLPYTMSARLPGLYQYNWGGGNSLGITSFSKHKDEAWQFIEFICSDEWQSKFFDYAGVLPASGQLSPDTIAKNPYLKGFLEVLPYGKKGATWRGADDLYPQLEKMIEEMTSNVLYNNMPPRQACEETQKKVEEFLKAEGKIK